MIEFAPSQYGPPCQALLTDAPPMELGPGSPTADRRGELEELNADALFSGRPIVDRQMAACCESALWLRHNFLEESHALSQAVPTPTGSYWHGIMHRREPDYSNAKFWFRKVGRHPIFPALHSSGQEIAAAHPASSLAATLAGQDAWDALAFIDMCEAAARGPSADRQLCTAVAMAEWRLLFDHCFKAAIGE